MLWFAQALNHLSSWQKIRKERQRKDSIDRTGSLNKDCLLHPGWGVHTLKPDAARLQWNEVHYGLKCEVWVAYLPGSSIITSNVPSFFIEKDKIWGVTWAHEQGTSVYVPLCEKQTGEWSPICEMKKIHGWESEEEHCVWKPQWRPFWLKTTSLPGPAFPAVCLHWELFQTARHAAHREKRLEKSFRGWNESTSVCPSHSTTGKHTPVPQLFSRPSSHSWFGNISWMQWEQAKEFCTLWVCVSVCGFLRLCIQTCLCPCVWMWQDVRRENDGALKHESSTDGLTVLPRLRLPQSPLGSQRWQEQKPDCRTFQ